MYISRSKIVRMVKVGEVTQIKTFKCVSEKGKIVRREVEVKSPLYINADNIVWIEPSPNLGSTIFFNTSKGSSGTASVTVHDVLVEDMLRIIKGEASYEDVKIEDHINSYDILKSRGQTKLLNEYSIPVMN